MHKRIQALETRIQRHENAADDVIPIVYDLKERVKAIEGIVINQI